MQLEALIGLLSKPVAYPFAVDHVEVRQTHISVVFLAGGFAYKLKKPVKLGFLDFSTLAARRHFCEEETRLNRRLAPKVYLGVVPIVRAGQSVMVEGHGEPIEWAVKMERLPDDATLLARLGRGEIAGEQLDALARRLAAFHASADNGPRVARFGSYDVVARNARENFEQAEAHVGRSVSCESFERARQLTEACLGRLQPVIESRAARLVPRDTHGDLHLDHVYLFPDRRPPDDLVIIDCIEFNERFRFADPIADMAFLVMDLRFRGRPDLAVIFANSYFAASGDWEGRALLQFYSAYRAAVRAKVDGMKAVESEVPHGSRERALQSARDHWQLALSELEADPGISA